MTEPNGAPDLLVIASVVDIARVLSEADTVATWSQANMFVPDAFERAALAEMDIAVLTELDVLADVCLRPHDRLDRSETVVRADLARRIPPAGLARLAAHTEDWAGVDYGRIRPLRVLSQRYTEDVDFYENRVAAQLVDRLGEYLTRRLRELNTLAAGLADLDEYDQTLRREQSWRRLKRVAHLVAQAVSDTTASAAAIEATRNRLLQARARLRTLKDAPVLKHANRRARLPTRLMRTNLFTNDRRYRRVGALWERWAVQEAGEKEKRLLVDRVFPAAYHNYVAALSLRAMAVLGYTPADSHAPTPVLGATMQLRGQAGELTWSIAADGVVVVSDGNTLLARVLTIRHDLGSSVVEPIRQEWFDQLSMLPGPTIVAYPGLRARRAALPEQARRRTHPAGFGSSPHVVPINPLEIEGEERLARALRWTVQGLRFTAEYPPKARLPVRTLHFVGNWFRPAGHQQIAITRRPSAEERVELERVLVDAADNSHRLQTRESVRDNLIALDAATNLFDLFQTCPICHSEFSEIRARNNNTFQCTCADCKAEWGTRVCLPCGKDYPILFAHNAVIDLLSGDRLDVTAGADLLTLPCADKQATPGSRFRCPWCGHCTGQPTCGCPMPFDIPDLMSPTRS